MTNYKPFKIKKERNNSKSKMKKIRILEPVITVLFSE